MPHAYVPDETIGNVAVAVHLCVAVSVIVGGALQLVCPRLRFLETIRQFAAEKLRAHGAGGSSDRGSERTEPLASASGSTRSLSLPAPLEYIPAELGL